MKTSSCHCKELKPHIIAVTDYEHNQLILTHIEVCDTCKKWYEDLGLIISEDQIKKYFG
jgi:hypothetical protein